MEIELSRLRMRGAIVSGSSSVSRITIHGNFGNVKIGNFCSIGRVYIQAHELVQIGDCAVVNDGVKIITGSHDIHCGEYKHKFAPILIGDYAWVAMDAIILQGVKIGYGAVVGAGSVVTKDVPALEVVAGNPARRVTTRRDPGFVYRPGLAYASADAWLGDR